VYTGSGQVRRVGGDARLPFSMTPAGRLQQGSDPFRGARTGAPR
jgi:hypothetical protein